MDQLKGVLLVNMGGPESPEELRNFLSNMFMDPCILPYGKPVRFLLSRLISRLRYQKSWLKYEQIGGTPLVRATVATCRALQSVLGEGYAVSHAFSYSEPSIAAAIEAMKAAQIREIIVLPLYPQASHTTTVSVKREVVQAGKRNPLLNISFVEEFYAHPGFVDFWANIIDRHLERCQIDYPTLVFSAHAIPEYHVTNGDGYATAVVNSAALIAERIGVCYEVAFQSGMRRGKWIGPDVREHLALLASEGVDDIVLVPISFVHENLETKYDLDVELIPYAKEKLGIQRISRVQLPETDPFLVGLLAQLVQKI